MGVRRKWVEWSPLIAMVSIECLDVGMSTLSKAAMSKGMNSLVFVVYSNALATLLLIPSSFYIHRTGPPLSFSLLCKFFLLGILGITIGQNCVFIGIDYSSPTLGSAMANMSPAITFVLAVTLRMEKLNIGSSISQIKVMGVVLSISGALVVTLYEGSSITTTTTTFRIPSLSSSLLAETSNSNWFIGGLFFAAASFSIAAWGITQALILKGYSSQITIIAYYFLFGTIQCAIISLILVRDLNAWKISTGIELICILFSAIVGSVVSSSTAIWCIKRKGPVFVSMFKPVGIVIAVFSSVVFLGETLYVGNIIGAVIIAIGFYAVLWAQSKDGNANPLEVDTIPSTSASDQASPLVESNGRNGLA